MPGGRPLEFSLPVAGLMSIMLRDKDTRSMHTIGRLVECLAKKNNAYAFVFERPCTLSDGDRIGVTKLLHATLAVNNRNTQ